MVFADNRKVTNSKKKKQLYETNKHLCFRSFCSENKNSIYRLPFIPHTSPPFVLQCSRYLTSYEYKSKRLILMAFTASTCRAVAPLQQRQIRSLKISANPFRDHSSLNKFPACQPWNSLSRGKSMRIPFAFGSVLKNLQACFLWAIKHWCELRVLLAVRCQNHFHGTLPDTCCAARRWGWGKGKWQI